MESMRNTPTFTGFKEMEEDQWILIKIDFKRDIEYLYPYATNHRRRWVTPSVIFYSYLNMLDQHEHTTFNF